MQGLQTGPSADVRDRLLNFGLDPTAQRTLEEALTTGFRTDVSGLGDVLRQQAEQQFQRSADIERERLAGLGAASSSARTRGVADIRSQLETALQRQLLEAEIGASEAAAGRRFGALGEARGAAGLRLGALGELGGLESQGIDQRIAALQGAGNLGLGADQLQLGSRQDLLELLTRQAPTFGGASTGVFGPSAFGATGGGAFGAASSVPNLSGRQVAITPGASRVSELDRLGQIGGTALQFNPSASLRGGTAAARGAGRFFALGGAHGGRIAGENDGKADDSAGTFRLDEGELVVPAALTERILASQDDSALIGALKRVADRLVPSAGGQAGGLAAQSRVQDIANMLKGLGGPVTQRTPRGRLTTSLGPGDIPSFELTGGPTAGLPTGEGVTFQDPDPVGTLMRQRGDAARRANLLRSAILERPNRPSNDRLIDALLSEQEAIQQADQGIAQLLGFQAETERTAAMQAAEEAQAGARIEAAQAQADEKAQQRGEKAADAAQKSFQAEINRAVARQLNKGADTPDLDAARQEAVAVIEAAGGQLPEAEQRRQELRGLTERHVEDVRQRRIQQQQAEPGAQMQQLESALVDLEGRADQLAPQELDQAAAILQRIVNDVRAQNPDLSDEDIESRLREVFPGLTGLLEGNGGAAR